MGGGRRGGRLTGTPGRHAGAPSSHAGEPGAKVAAVVLAAGGGSRFAGGGHKLLAPFLGRPLVAWAIDAAVGAELGAVVVVTGAVDLGPATVPFGDGITVIVNARWAEGQATSLRAALDWCGAHGFEAAVVGVGDQPLVGSAAWRRVGLATHAAIVTASFAGRRRPPVRLDRAVWDLVAGEGDEGARELMRRRPELTGEVACEGDPADVDTFEDLRRAEAAAGPSSAT